MYFIHGFLFKTVDDMYDTYNSDLLKYISEILYFTYVLINYKQEEKFISMIGLSVIVSTLSTKITGNTLMMNYQYFRMKYGLFIIAVPLLIKNVLHKNMDVIVFSSINMFYVSLFDIPDKLFFDNMLKSTNLLKIKYRSFILILLILFHKFEEYMWPNLLKYISSSTLFWIGYASASIINMSIYLVSKINV